MQARKSIKFILKLLARTLGGILSFLILYFITEYVLSSIRTPSEKPHTKEMYIYVQTNGVHTDLIVPIKNSIYDWSKQLDIKTTKAQDTSAQFVAIGWGDKGFYLETPTWAELKASTALKAALGLSSTAMHCTFHTQLKETQDRRKVFLDSNQYRRLIAFINKSFKWKNEQTILVNTTVRYNRYDTFYEAVGNYSMLRTCNTWTNQALKAAGLKASQWVAFERGIMKNYR